MARAKLISIAAACVGVLAIAACSPERAPEPIDAVPTEDTPQIAAINGEPVQASAGAVANLIAIEAPAPKGWTYRHLSQVEGCNIGVLNYGGQEVILTSARSHTSSYPVACGAAVLP